MIISKKNITCTDYMLHELNFFCKFTHCKKGDVLLEFSSVKWVLNEDYSFYSNLVGTLLLQNFALVNSYFIEFFVGRTTVEIEGIRFM